MQSSSIKVTGYIVYISIHANIESRPVVIVIIIIVIISLALFLSLSHSRTLICIRAWYARAYMYTYVSPFFFFLSSLHPLILSRVIGTEKRKTTSSRSLSHNCQSSGTQLKFPSARFYHYFLSTYKISLRSSTRHAAIDLSLCSAIRQRSIARKRLGSLPLIFRVEIASSRIHRNWPLLGSFFPRWQVSLFFNFLRLKVILKYFGD